MSTFIDSNGIYYLLDSSNNTASVVNNVSYGTLTTANILSSFATGGITYTVTSIEANAFSSSPNLTLVTMPNSVTTIGDYAFQSCSGLTSVTVSNRVTTIGIYVFAYCNSLISITIPEGVTTIGNVAFYSCSNLTSVTIPNSVTSIGFYSFSSCPNLTSLLFQGEQLPSINADAFDGPNKTLYYTSALIDPTFTLPPKFTTKILISSPTITSISPSTASIGTTITITGTNLNTTNTLFTPTYVTFDNSNAEITSISNTSIACTAPIHVDGEVNVTVNTSGGSASSTFTYIPNPISNICFPAGTPITTNQGNIPIEKINPDIHTIRNKKIVGITQTISQDKYLVCFEKDSLSKNLPSQTTIISKNHCIFYKGSMLKASDFIDKFENVKKVKYRGEVLYNVLMEENDKMMVNNLICETLDPVNGIAKLYNILKPLSQDKRQIMIKKYNEYAIKNNIFSTKIIRK